MTSFGKFERFDELSNDFDLDFDFDLRETLLPGLGSLELIKAILSADTGSILFTLAEFGGVSIEFIDGKCPGSVEDLL